MKVKVNVKYRDKHTKKIIKKDTVMEISKERYEEICKTNDKLVSVVVDSEENVEADATVEDACVEAADVDSEENVEADATTKKSRGRKSK